MADALSNKQLGIVLLVLLLAYCAIGSGYLPFRRVLELSEASVFTHWLFAGLVAVFCAVLILATLRRIRFSRFNAGVITIHAGMLVLTVGSAYYFANKIEGDVLLRPPMIHLVSAQRLASTGDLARSKIGQLVAAEGRRWRQDTPAIGGVHQIEVLSVTDHGLRLAEQVILGVRVGDQPARQVSLAAGPGAADGVFVSDHLLAWLESPRPSDRFYEDESPALYLAHEGRQYVLPIPGLPIHGERFLSAGDYVYDTTERIVNGAAARPIPLLGGWRMPIPLTAGDLPFRVQITGYLPYVKWVAGIAGDGDVINPMTRVRLEDGPRQAVGILRAHDPREALWNLVELVWLTDPAQLAELTSPLAGPHTLEVHVKDAAVRRRYAIQPGDQIPVEGTDYHLTVDGLIGAWPLMSPGFEGASSPVAQITVWRGDLQFQRTVIQRFRQLSQDIGADGMRHRKGLLDPNIELSYFDASRGWATLVAGPALQSLQLIVTAPDGQRFSRALALDQPIDLDADLPWPRLTVLDFESHGRRVTEPRVVPGFNRRPQMGRLLSAIRVQLDGQDPAAPPWTRSIWVPFSQYLDEFAEPRQLGIPLGEQHQPQTIELTFSRTTRPLPGPIVLEQMEAHFFPGRQRVSDWHSYFRFGQRSGEVRRSMVRLNHTSRFGPWTLFQASEAPDHESYSVLGVGNRPGIWVMMLGCVLTALGMIYAFYVKPILKRAGSSLPAGEPARTDSVAYQPVELSGGSG